MIGEGEIYFERGLRPLSLAHSPVGGEGWLLYTRFFAPLRMTAGGYAADGARAAWVGIDKKEKRLDILSDKQRDRQCQNHDTGA